MRGKGQDENKYLKHRWSASCARLKLYCLNPIRVVLTLAYTITVLLGVCDVPSHSDSMEWKHHIATTSSEEGSRRVGSLNAGEHRCESAGLPTSREAQGSG